MWEIESEINLIEVFSGLQGNVEKRRSVECTLHGVIS